MKSLVDLLNENILGVNRDTMFDKISLPALFIDLLKGGLKIGESTINAICKLEPDDFLNCKYGQTFASNVKKRAGVDISRELAQYIHDHIHYISVGGGTGIDHEYDSWEIPSYMYIIPGKDKGTVYKDVRSYKFSKAISDKFLPVPKRGDRYKRWLAKNPYPSTMTGSELIDSVFKFLDKFKYKTTWREDDKKYIYTDNIYCLREVATGIRSKIAFVWTTFSDWQNDQEKELNDLIIKAV